MRNACVTYFVHSVHVGRIVMLTLNILRLHIMFCHVEGGADVTQKFPITSVLYPVIKMVQTGDHHSG